jgi:hypothetical protein
MSPSRTLPLVAIVLLAGSARAEDEDRFVEACDSGAWVEAEKAWAELPGEQPVSLVLQHADVLVHLGRKDEARKAAESVRERDPGNVLALAQLARLSASTSPEAAKDLLIEAARGGYYVLREVRSAKELRALGDEPRFVLAVMRASSDQRAFDGPKRNPFRPPFSGTSAAVPEPKKPIVKVDSKEPAKRLQEYVSRANTLLRTLSRLLREEKLQEMRAPFEEAKALVEAMRRESDPDFQRDADLVDERVSRLETSAARLQRIKDLEIEVTGIVVTRDAPSRAIVSLGKASGIYGVGDQLRDGSGRSSGVEVSGIHEGFVSFKLEDLEFRRELRRAR